MSQIKNLLSSNSYAAMISFFRVGGILLALGSQLLIARYISLDAYVVYVFSWSVIYFSSKVQTAGIRTQLIHYYSSFNSNDLTERVRTTLSQMLARSFLVLIASLVVLLVGEGNLASLLFVSCLYAVLDFMCHILTVNKRMFVAGGIQLYLVQIINVILLFLLISLGLSETAIIPVSVAIAVLVAMSAGMVIAIVIKCLKFNLVTEALRDAVSEFPGNLIVAKKNVSSALYELLVVVTAQAPNLVAYNVFGVQGTAAFYAAWRAVVSIDQFYQPLLVVKTLALRKFSVKARYFVLVNAFFAMMIFSAMVILSKPYLGLVSPDLVSYWPVMLLLSVAPLAKILIIDFEARIIHAFKIEFLVKAEFLGLMGFLFGVMAATLILQSVNMWTLSFLLVLSRSLTLASVLKSAISISS